MTTIEMNMDGCDVAHEALMLKEYGMEAGSVVRIHGPANDRGHASIPTVDPPSASEEVSESFVLLPSTAFPHCP